MRHHQGTIPELETHVEEGSIEPTGMSSLRLLEDFAKRNDQAAFAQLVQLHGPLVYGVCRRVTGHHHDAEDAFQATFVILSRKAATIKSAEILPGWLYRVAYHVSLRAKTAANRRRAKEQAMSEADVHFTSAPDLWNELAPVLDQELSKLAEKYRNPLLLCDLGGSTQKEAALELGCSEGTLSSRLLKARSLLAQRLAKQGFTLSAGALSVLISQNAAVAAVPTSLFAATIHTTTLASIGDGLNAHATTSNAMTLAKGTLNSMSVVTLKSVGTGLIALSMIAFGLQSQRANQNLAAAELPADLRKGLEDNARKLNPITVSYTQQLTSQLSDEETFERLRLTPERSRYPNQLTAYSRRVIWQGQKFYLLAKKAENATSLRETSCDGDTLFDYEGDVPDNLNEGRFYKTSRSAVAEGKGNRTLLFWFFCPYFRDFSGLTFPEGKEQAIELRPESELIAALRQGAKLVSVENTQLEDRRCVKVEIVTSNMQKVRADQIDMESLRRRTSGLPNAAEAEKREVERVMAARQLPESIRVVFYFDPDLGYALRRREEWYGSKGLVARCDCSDFQQVAERGLWLPRKCETQYGSHPLAPGVMFDTPFLTEVVKVTELSDATVADQQFVLNYNLPGVEVEDEALGALGAATVRIGTSIALYKTRPDSSSVSTKGDHSISNEPVILQPSSNSISRWIVLANGIVLFLIVGFFLYRRLT